MPIFDSTNQITMTTLALKELTLNMSVAQLIVAGQVKTQDDLVTIAKFYMTDLKISFKEALDKIADLQTKIANAQNDLLAA